MFSVKVKDARYEPAEKKPRLNEDDLRVSLSLAVRMAQMKAMEVYMKSFPLFHLLVKSGKSASLSISKESRVPVSSKDVQDLIVCSISGKAQHLNRWFYLTQWKKAPQTVVLVVDNFSVNYIEDNQELFPETLGFFEDGVEMINSNNAGLHLSVALAYLPITNALKLKTKVSSLKEAFDDGHIFRMMDISEQNQEKETSVDDSKKLDQTEMNGKLKFNSACKSDTIVKRDVLLMKFFAHVQSLDKSALLITNPTHDKIYRPKTPLHRGLFGSVKAVPVEIFQESELQCVVPALESKMDKDLVFIHTNIDKEKTDQEHLKKLDKVIADVYNKLAMNGMMVVIFGGKTNPLENGVCMIRVKKPCPPEYQILDKVVHH